MWWLEDLATEAHRLEHYVCSAHAEGVRVPQGWELRDERNGVAVPQHSQLDLIGA